MARKTKDLVIADGRDKGKTFVITEMSVIDADNWANRALLAMLRGGVDVGNLDFSNVNTSGGMLELARVVIAGLGNMQEQIATDLLNELLDCARIVNADGSTREILMDEINCEIESIKTLWQIRKEALMIHIDFLTDGSSQA